MERQVRLEEISDGRKYGLNDMVRADCNGCEGCSVCCQGMGNSITLDPLDIYNLTTNLNMNFEGLLAERIELSVIDGIILPNLKMAGSKERCSFLNEKGRCDIHAFRPGICRLFPLGRCYEENTLYYILQVHECKKSTKSKIKVQKWIDIPDIKKNEQFIIEWHNLMKLAKSIITQVNDNKIKELNMYLLNTFFVTPYDPQLDFYSQFHERHKMALVYLNNK